MNKFEYAINFTLPWEAGRNIKGQLREDGGYNSDDGSPTKWGIRQAANPTVDVPNLTKEAAIEIYRTKYWDAYSLNSYELGLSIVMFDTGVNCGPGNMKRFYEKAKGQKDMAHALIQQRNIHYQEIVAKDREKYGQFLRGWLNRSNDLSKYIDIARIETTPVQDHTDQTSPNAS